MSRKEKLPPELIAFEAELASLRPDTGDLDVGRLMFLAGRESVRKSPRRLYKFAWPTAFTAMTAAAAVLLMMLVNRPQPETIERIVRVEVPMQQAEPSTESVISPKQLPDNETRSPDVETASVETAVVKTADEDSRDNLKNNPRSTLNMLAAVIFKRERPAHSSTIARHRPSYQELRELVLTQGVESWPVQANGNGNHSKPLSREAFTKSLLGDEG